MKQNGTRGQTGGLIRRKQGWSRQKLMLSLGINHWAVVKGTVPWPAPREHMAWCPLGPTWAQISQLPFKSCLILG